MNKSYLIIVVPALIVAAAYVALMLALDAEVRWAPFVGVAVLAAVAFWFVRRNAKREAAERAKKAPAARPGPGAGKAEPSPR